MIKEIYIIAEGITMVSFIATSSGAIINILLNLYLIPTYQEIGASIATVIAYSIPAYFICLFYGPLKPIGRIMTKSLSLIWVLEYFKNKFEVKKG